MKTGAFILTFVMFFTLPALGFSASFKVYPGARVEEVYEANQSETGAKMSKSPKVIIFTTNDFFENVVAFYRGTGREYRMPGSSGKPTNSLQDRNLKKPILSSTTQPTS